MIKTNLDGYGNEIKEKVTVYDVVTERIIDMLEGGVVPWRKPWKSSQIAARNAITHHTYSGINWFLTNGQCYDSPDWLTFNQAKKAGYQVRKGEKATPITFWKTFEGDVDEKTGKARTIPMIRYYNVFNMNQLDNVEPEYQESVQREIVEIVDAAKIAQGYAGASIEYGRLRACYSPSLDRIMMPDRQRFDSDPAYYATLYHEMVHSTGHESRLAREGIVENHFFGDSTYSKEELVAEMGSAFLCSLAGIDGSTLPQSASYIDHWLKVLRGDNKAVVKAAAAAKKASDFILGINRAEEIKEAA